MLPRFCYMKFRRLEDALEFLEERGERAKVVAGGTDLLVQLRNRKIPPPEYLVDISSIEELRGIKEVWDAVSIGALTTIGEIEDSEAVRRHARVLTESARHFASWQIRNMATIGGNLCNASPAADMATPLLVLGANLKLRSLKGSRTVSVEEFFVGPGKTCLEPNEILTEVIVPRKDDYRQGFSKLGRRASHTISIVNVAVSLKTGGGEFRDVRIALGAVAPKPVRARSAEEALLGNPVSFRSVEEASKRVLEDIAPVDDVRASAKYRREMSVYLTRKTLVRVLEGERLE